MLPWCGLLPHRRAGRLAMLSKMFKGIKSSGASTVILTFNKTQIVKDAMQHVRYMMPTRHDTDPVSLLLE